ncbi:MAG: metallophosphoesterase [Proteobacteria bacterium]|nr:metallophosphoesterase [Pseudomonadota bacterium]
MSRKVLLVADNQVHYLYGDPFIQRSVFTDKHFSSTAIRPPQLDLFGQDLFRWALQSAQRSMPVIHLGDALDLACAAEFDQFAALMKQSGRTWVMTPGNHDSYFFGNFDDIDHFWQAACRRGDGPLRKHQLIGRYIDELATQWASLGRQFAANPHGGHWQCDPQIEDNCFLQAIWWRIDIRSRWRSYVVQKVDLSRPGSGEPMSAILIDSTQYSDNPRTLFLHAGSEGSLLSDQAAVIEKIVANAARSGEKVVLAMHHPYDIVSSSSQRYVDRFMRAYPSLLLISAHSHAGRYYTHGSGNHTWLELNIGSILDWPVEYRTLAFRRSTVRDGLGKRGIILASELIRLPQQWTEDLEEDVPECKPAWEARPGDLDYYLDYYSLSTPNYITTQHRIYDNLLAAYKRMFRCLPQLEARRPADSCGEPSEVDEHIDRALADDSLDQKRKALLWLREYERERKYQNPKHKEHYSLCQARWASWYEDRRTRIPQVSDEYILVPYSEKKQKP